MTNILGISCFYHDSAAALVQNGVIIAAAQEERFTRKKHDPGFPARAIEYVLQEGGITAADVDIIAFYDKPMLKFERLLESILDGVPGGLPVWFAAIPDWLDHKLNVRGTIKKRLENLNKDVRFCFLQHHESHAAAAFYPSPYQRAAFLTLDGVGEWATTSWGVAHDNEIEIRQEIHFPHSLGLLYSAFTAYTGFKVNSGEYKVMGLAPYGEPEFVQRIYDNIIDIREDGSFRMNMQYFDYANGLRMANEKFYALFGGPPRKPEARLTQREMNLARSVQVVIEEAILKLGRHIKKESNENNLCLAGGVALNCVANGILYRSGLFKNIWVQPAAGDAGSALGSALFAHYRWNNNQRVVDGVHDLQKGSYLGPGYSADQIKAALAEFQAPYTEAADKLEAGRKAAAYIAEGKVVGWFSGRMEFGPRALGARSILGDPRSESMQSTMNLKIKFRESFRPFAPSCLREDVNTYFEHDAESPYMLMVAPVRQELRRTMSEAEQALFGIEKLNVKRSELPAITHVDYSARIQTVTPDNNPAYYELIKEFKRLSGYGVVINTSFNVRGEPIVRTPEEAYLCFMRTHMDVLVLDNIILEKTNQPALAGDTDWQQEFELD